MKDAMYNDLEIGDFIIEVNGHAYLPRMCLYNGLTKHGWFKTTGGWVDDDGEEVIFNGHIKNQFKIIKLTLKQANEYHKRFLRVKVCDDTYVKNFRLMKKIRKKLKEN